MTVPARRRGGSLLRLAASASAVLLLSSPKSVHALDNGFSVPPMGWSSWYGNLWNIDESMIREMADAMVSSGLRDLGYRTIWIDDGFAVGRDRLSRKLMVDSKLFPSGMRALSDYVHERELLFGVYTSVGQKTCMGYSNRPNQPKREETGACGYEEVDADMYANDWQIDALKNDGCGNCIVHAPKDPYAVMRDALNKTGRHIYYAVHKTGDGGYGVPHDDVANDWRTGIDLCCPWYGLWLHLLDEATTPQQRARVGPGSFANPDFLQVGFSRSKGKNRKDIPLMSPLERRSHYTMWAALPAPLMLGAELRPGKEYGDVYDPYTFETVTNPEVIAVNQDPLVAPMRPIVDDKGRGLQVWLKPLAPVVQRSDGGGLLRWMKRTEESESFAVVLFHRTNIDTSGPAEGGAEWHTPRPDPPSVAQISVNWSQLGHPDCAAFEVRDLWAKATLGVFCGEFGADVEEREARIYRFTRVTGADARTMSAGGQQRQCGCQEDGESSFSRILAFGKGGSSHRSVVGYVMFVACVVMAVGMAIKLGIDKVLPFAAGYLPVSLTEEEGRRE